MNSRDHVTKLHTMNETESIEDSSYLQQYLPQWLWIYFFAITQIWKDFIDNLVLASIAGTHFLLLYIIIGALTYVYLVNFSSKGEKSSKRVLFVIAHPDDECMFFGPTILSLINSSEVYLLCLSIGNHYKVGSLRKEELYKSCSALGIPQSNIVVMNSTKMPDDPGVIWNTKRTARIILDHVESLSIEEVYTFDIGGVSGHSNHISIFYGVARLCISGELPSSVKVFLLESVNKVRKYIGCLDAALTALPLTQRQYVISVRDSGVVRRAMRQHRSQMVWYRAIYIHLSRYMYMNTYKELEIEDVQLDLQLADYNPML